jgi:hypothetical protein
MSWTYVMILGSSYSKLHVFMFFCQCHHMSLIDFMASPPGCEAGTPMRRSDVAPMSWMVIYKYKEPGGTLNLSSTKLPRPWSPWESSPSKKNPHGRTGNRTRGLMISSQKLWPLDLEAGHTFLYKSCKIATLNSPDLFQLTVMYFYNFFTRPSSSSRLVYNTERRIDWAIK